MSLRLDEPTSAWGAARGERRLDARQRAMLEEMGVKVWWPADAAVAVADAVRRAMLRKR